MFSDTDSDYVLVNPMGAPKQWRSSSRHGNPPGLDPGMDPTPGWRVNGSTPIDFDVPLHVTGGRIAGTFTASNPPPSTNNRPRLSQIQTQAAARISRFTSRRQSRTSSYADSSYSSVPPSPSPITPSISVLTPNPNRPPSTFIREPTPSRAPWKVTAPKQPLLKEVRVSAIELPNGTSVLARSSILGPSRSGDGNRRESNVFDVIGKVGENITTRVDSLPPSRRQSAVRNTVVIQTPRTKKPPAVIVVPPMEQLEDIPSRAESPPLPSLPLPPPPRLHRADSDSDIIPAFDINLPDSDDDSDSGTIVMCSSIRTSMCDDKSLDCLGFGLTIPSDLMSIVSSPRNSLFSVKSAQDGDASAQQNNVSTGPGAAPLPEPAVTTPAMTVPEQEPHAPNAQLGPKPFDVEPSLALRLSRKLSNDSFHSFVSISSIMIEPSPEPSVDEPENEPASTAIASSPGLFKRGFVNVVICFLVSATIIAGSL